MYVCVYIYSLCIYAKLRLPHTSMYEQVNGAIAFTTLTLFNTLRLPLVKLPKS